ncbi:ComEC/Rec2 family competence protein [Paracoccus spongiarum]|uniref:ComEC/Rec2 family competence protein n=1 Tax=Paracoccus spongiarum TaxID=3064387 RepID=A0ABT9JAJ4_9RHOB|nr:ComEC/Rec2 family competence protein [Paracoccus sp. 2205BS29-5]MDP5306828.1 ComEC/Rec2 family competence protein [Paracoccus sp. 2205BS29-5]
MAPLADPLPGSPDGPPADALTVSRTSAALPGFAPSRTRAPVARVARPPRPAAVGRAGLFVWVPVCLALGIAGWFALPAPPGWPLRALVVALAALGLTCARAGLPLAERGRIGWPLADFLRVGGMALLLVAAGAGLAGLRSAQVAAPILEWRYYGPVEGRLIEIDRSARDRLRLTLDQLRLRDTPPQRTPARVRLSLMDQAALDLPALGRRVMLTGHLGPPPGPAAPGSFDFRRHAWFERLGAVGYTRSPVLAVAEAEGGLWAMHRARMAISDAIRARIGGQEGAVAAALMTGDRSGIEEATNEVMRASNLYHIISISGLHMSMLAGFVYAALRIALAAMQGLRVGAALPIHKLAALAALLAAAGYLWLSGGGVATERAFVMVAVMLLAILADRRAISLRTVALAATIILAYSPEALASPGFQMSFAATVALILSYGPWSRLSPHLPVWLRPVAMLLVSSLVAALATSPIAAAHFNRMAQYGLLANLLVVPVMGTLVMPAGVIAALLAPVGLAGPALWVMGVGTAWMLMVARFVADLGGAVSAVALPPAAVLPLMGFGATLAVLCWRGRFARPLGILTLGRGAGLAMLAAAAVLWLAESRPLLLVAPEGEAVGLMTDAGRAVSKPAGGAFVVKTWLLEDGDIATQAEAAARTAWRGDRRDRQADLPGGWQILHLTGKGAGQRAGAACRPRRILVATEAVTGLPDPPDCLVLDPPRLRRSGAVAIEMTADGPQLRSATGRPPGAGRP